jgi:hypothetical protein
MIVVSWTSLRTVSVSGFFACLAQVESGRLMSASITVTVAPCSASAVASRIADVDFPDPPLELAMTMVGIRIPLSDQSKSVTTMLAVHRQKSICLLFTDNAQFVY